MTGLQTFLLSVTLFLGMVSPLPVWSQTAAEVSDEVPVVTYSGKSYYKYTVKPKETVYSLSRFFGVTEEELVVNNPFLRKGLKAGQLLLIPVKERPQKQVQAMPADSLPSETVPAGAVSFSDTIPAGTPHNEGKVSFALLLPLMLDDTTAVSNERYIEYYEGMLLAADTLRRLGVSMDIAVYDIGKTRYSLQKVLAQNRFSGVDYVIAAAGNAQMPELSQWAFQNRKPLILPFSSRIPETASNPYIYQVNAPKEMAFSRLLDRDMMYFLEKKILLLRTSSEEKDERLQLFSRLKKKLSDSGIPFRELTDANLKVDDGETYRDLIEPLISADSVNLIIPAPVSLNEANRILSQVMASSNAVHGSRVELWGYPEWIALSKSNLPSLHRMNTSIYGYYFADFSAPDVRAFEIRYSRAFGKDILNTYPRYAMMSYDVTVCFVSRLLGFDYGIAPLQHSLHFVRTSPQSGWYNDNVWQIHYNPDRTITAGLLP